MAVYLILAFALFGFVVYSVLHYAPKKDVKSFNYEPQHNSNLNDDEVELCMLINQHRINLGLNALISEILASEVCKDRIYADIANGRKPSHLGFETRIKQAKANLGGEICAQGYNTPLSLFFAYLNSKEHRECIEKPYYTHIGISLIEKRNYCLLTKY